MDSKTLPPYAPTLMESTRAIGYSLEAAIADIIDNSIAAEAQNICLFFFPLNGAYIAILDDGYGMNDKELDTAMQYGSQNPLKERADNDLGRFGLGLKTASLSQCRRLTVVSKQGAVISARRWDVDFVADTGEWSLLILDDEDIKTVPEIEKLMEYTSGTLVVWQELDRLKAGETNFEQAMGKKIDVVRDHLSLVYHRYLTGEPGIKRIKLAINGEKVQPTDPFLTNKSEQVMDDEIIIVRGQEIVVRPYILPHISKMTPEEIKQLGGKDGLRRQQGFYVYRNKRLLVWGTWFRMMRQGDLSKLARVQVDIPNTLDDLWTLDIKKSSAMPPAEVRDNLKVIIDRIAERSKRTWTFRGKKEVSDKDIHIWNRMKNSSGGYYYEINRQHPMVKQLYQGEKSQQNLVDSLLQQVERNLPLNQIYVDMNNDEQLDNDQEQNVEDIITALRATLNMRNSKEEKSALLEEMSSIEPFSNYPDALERLKREIENE